MDTSHLPGIGLQHDRNAQPYRSYEPTRCRDHGKCLSFIRAYFLFFLLLFRPIFLLWLLRNGSAWVQQQAFIRWIASIDKMYPLFDFLYSLKILSCSFEDRRKRKKEKWPMGSITGWWLENRHILSRWEVDQVSFHRHVFIRMRVIFTARSPRWLLHDRSVGQFELMTMSFETGGAALNWSKFELSLARALLLSDLHRRSILMDNQRLLPELTMYQSGF